MPCIRNLQGSTNSPEFRRGRCPHRPEKSYKFPIRVIASEKSLNHQQKSAPASAEALFTIGSVSRVLSSTVIYLGAPLPVRSSHLLGSSRASLASSAVLLRIEFTAMDAFTRHWVSSYLAFPSLPRRRKLHIPRPAASGRSRSFRCAASPHKTFVLRGTHFWASGGLFLLHFSSDRSGRALPVILALRSPDFPHARPFGAAPATVRPGRACIVLYLQEKVKWIAISFPRGYNTGRKF